MERDWSQAPLSEEPQGLSVALHDATLLGIQEDRMERMVRLRFEPGFPSPDQPVPATINMTIRGVSHLLIFTIQNWPGGAPRVVTPITPEVEAAVEAYRKKARIQTAEVEALLTAFEGGMQIEVMQATLHHLEEGVTFVFEGYDTVGDHWWQFQIAGEGLEVEPISLEELIQLGSNGWDAWEKRGPGKTTGA